MITMHSIVTIITPILKFIYRIIIAINLLFHIVEINYESLEKSITPLSIYSKNKTNSVIVVKVTTIFR